MAHGLGVHREGRERVSQLAKEPEDKAMGWRCDEVRTLTARKNGVASCPLRAEVQREPVMGFSPIRERVTVRLRIDLHSEEESRWLREEEGGCFLFDGDCFLFDGETLFGPEKGWQIRYESIRDQSIVTILLES
jgi:hypothetical protein